MSKRLAIALFSALACVIAATLASVALLVRAHEHTLVRSAERAADHARGLYESHARARRALLQQLCTRDVHVERLALELTAGGSEDADASRAALGLSRVLESDVWVALERGAELALLGSSARPPTSLPSPTALRASAQTAHVFPGDAALLIESCARSLGAETLWIVRSEPLARVRTAIDPHEPAARFIEPALAGRAHGGEHADALVLRIAGVDDGPPGELWLRASEPPRFATLLAFGPLFLLLLVFGGLIAYFAAVRVADSDLLELEQAAERVAKGDLTTRIERRPGGRADQTFQTFDRMTAELQDMRLRLAEAERAAAWQDMARRIAHEIKNPLSPIQMAIETLRKAHEKRLPAFDEIFQESTRAILEEVRRMERIVREFSEFARLPRARPGALDLAALVADTLALYQPDDVRVAFVPEPGGVAVRADRELIVQVLVNLLQNAAAAAREAAQPQIVLRVEANARGAFVHVDDNGRGIPPSERERVFEPYYTTKEHGTGLGLAIVRRIALDHEGGVQVSASPLGGARFTLRLPKAE